jgi:uncharacterized membrane protein
MNAMSKIVAAIVMLGTTSFVSTSVAAAWWDNDRYYDDDRWYGGPWYGYGGPWYGGYPGWGYSGWGYPGWGYPGWGGYPGHGYGSTIIVNPENSGDAEEPVSRQAPQPRIPR